MFSFRATSQEAGQRLDRYLQNKTGLSRKKVKGLLDHGQVLLDGRKVIIASWKIRSGNQVEVREEGGIRHPRSAEYYLKLIYEDADLLVINKDAGVPCEKTPLATTPTEVEIINAYFRRKYPHLKTHYLAPVHRLDRDTSGLMVFSKSREANRLTEQFKRHSIERRYLALVDGSLPEEKGTISGYLKKGTFLKGGRKVTLSTPASGKKAVTHWQLLERYQNASLLEVTLNTGRTHQIRVHLASIGHPIVGDRIYGGPVHRFARQALHASFLAFRHPVTNKKMEFELGLPRDLRRLVDHLRLKTSHQK